jgi:hypothetical protein
MTRAAPGERTDERTAYANGFKGKALLLEPGERVRTPAQLLLQKKSCFISERPRAKP